MKHQLTIAYTPQQNGVPERKDRTIIEMDRSMLLEKDLPKIFWAKAVNSTIYLLNRCPTKVVSNQTPLKTWSGKKTKAYYKSSEGGCICYIHVPSQKKKKHKLNGKYKKMSFS